MKVTEERYREREALAVFLYGVCLCLTLMHFVHNGWYQVIPPDAPPPTKIYAPDVYRVAIPALARTTIRLTGMHQLAWLYAELDFVWGLCTVGLLYLLAVDAMPLNKRRERLIRLTLLLTLLTLTWNWVVPWQRPETTPSCCFLAFALFCFSRTQKPHYWTAGLLLATLWQAFVRFDVAFVYGAALTLTSLVGAGSVSTAKRRAGTLQGLAVMAIAGAAQAYLQLVRYPHRRYDPRTPMFSLSYNLNGNHLATATLALLPFLLAALALSRPQRIGRPGVLALVAAGLYLPLWFAVALTSEVRVYVPFLTILCLPMSEAIMGYLLNDAAA